MSHIISMPKNISYYPTTDLKKDGRRIMALDISKTYVQMIPELMTGVDRVIVRPGQLQYIAPDYKGQVYVRETHWRGAQVSYVEQPMPREEFFTLRGKYVDQTDLSEVFFDQSYFASRISTAYPDEEINLPKKLHFSWNFKSKNGNRKRVTR